MTTLRQAIRDEIISNTEGMSFEETKHYIENDAICVNGAVNGLIYYHDTIAFFDNHEDEILDLAQECEFELKPTEIGMTGYKNNMAWFAFETLAESVFFSMLFEESEEVA